MRKAFIGLLTFGAIGLVAVADTGTPFPSGTKVEIGTPAGTVSGTLRDRTKDGWLFLLEPGRALPTAIPERAVGFIRPMAPKDSAKLAKTMAPPMAPPDASAAAPMHFVFGQPRVQDRKRFAFIPDPGSSTEVDGVTVLQRFAYTVGHYDKFKVPAWVAMRWSKVEFHIAASQPTHPRNFVQDDDLPDYARTGKDYQHAKFGYERGHMARHEDLSGFGVAGDARIGTREGCFMSNIVPQQRKGHIVWGLLEKEHHDIVANSKAGISAVWLIAGPIFKNGKPRDVIGPDKVGAPDAVYKIIAWKTANGDFSARAYIIEQDDTGTDLKAYLTTIDNIEAQTGLDFFSDMDDLLEEALESKTFSKLWDE